MFDTLIKKLSNTQQQQHIDNLNKIELNQYSMIELQKIRHQEEHVYEEIQENNLNHYYSDISNDICEDFGTKTSSSSSSRKCVRFNPRNELTNTIRLSSLNSILKKPSLDSNESELSSSTNSSCSFGGTSGCGGYYTNNSISSTNSSSSNHSLVFNQLVDDFLNRLPDKPNDAQTKAKKSKHKNSEKQQTKKDAICLKTNNQSLNNDPRLSFRVTNLTLDDLKKRQKVIYLNTLSKATTPPQPSTLSNRAIKCDENNKLILNQMPIQI